MKVAFDVSKLTTNLTAIRAHIEAQGVRRAVIKGAQVIGAAMVDRTPVLVEKMAGSTSLEPGEVKNGIKVRSRTEDEEPVALVGPTGKYGKIAKVAHLVEYGHRMVHGGSSILGADGKFHGKNGAAAGRNLDKDVPAYPFLRPAYEASAGEAIQVMGDTLREELPKGIKA